MAGSCPDGIEAMTKGISDRLKGRDLLRRIPKADASFSLPDQTLGDVLLIFVARIIARANQKGLRIKGINKCAAFFILHNVSYHSPRQLDDLASRAVERMVNEDEIVRLAHLFESNDNEPYRFWSGNAGEMEVLSDSDISISG